MKKFNELYNEKQKYIKEKQIIEQELTNNKIKIIDLQYQNKLLKDRFDNSEKCIDLKNKDFKIDSLLKDFEINNLPKSNKELNRLKKLREEYQNITEKINIPNLSELLNTERDRFIDTTKLEKLDINNTAKINENDELNISDARIKYFDKIIKENPEMSIKKINIIKIN